MYIITAGSYAERSGVTGGYGDTRISYKTLRQGLVKKGESSTKSNTLKRLEMKTVSNSQCSSLYTRISSSLAVAQENMCAVSEAGDLCDGDRGAGLVMPDCGKG